MNDLNDSLTEIDWLNSLRIKKSETGYKDETSISVNKYPIKYNENLKAAVEQTYSVPMCNGFEKPSYSYAYLIKLAIESSKNNRMKLSEIYAWIIDKFPYYKYVRTDNCKGWKNAIRHNLSLNKVFKRYPKNSVESGKGSYWTIDSECAERFIQNPPMKKMKVSNLFPNNNKKTPYLSTKSVSKKVPTDIFRSSDNVEKSVVNANEHSKSLSLNSDPYNPPEILITDNSIKNYNSSSSAFSLHSSIFQNEGKKDIVTNSLTDRSAFVPYSVHNYNTSRSCEISNSTCEISYSSVPKYHSSLLQTPQMMFSNYSRRYFTKGKKSSSTFGLQFKDNLEIEEGDNENGNNDIILKTPVLSQFNAGSDFKDSSEENFIIKFPKVIEATDTNFDTNSLYDSFLSFHNSLLEYETLDHRHIFPSIHTEKTVCQEISISQNVSIFSKSQFNREYQEKQINENQNLLEGSLGLSASSKHILLNVSGFGENWLSTSQWLDFNESNNLQNQSNSDVNSSSNIDYNAVVKKFDNHLPNQDGIIPSQEFLEMKNYLRCHRFKNNSVAESTKPSSVSTSSTVKSTDTVPSKSPACDKRIDLDASNAINSNDALLLMDQVSKSQLSEEEDIDDCFNWSACV